MRVAWCRRGIAWGVKGQDRPEGCEYPPTPPTQDRFITNTEPSALSGIGTFASALEPLRLFPWIAGSGSHSSGQELVSFARLHAVCRSGRIGHPRSDPREGSPHVLKQSPNPLSGHFTEGSRALDYLKCLPGSFVTAFSATFPPPDFDHSSLRWLGISGHDRRTTKGHLHFGQFRTAVWTGDARATRPEPYFPPS